MSDIFFNFSAANNGDGTTAGQAAGGGGVGAYNTFDGVSPASGDVWWVRRSGTKVTITTQITPVDHFSICGWPMNGDKNWDDRPASGQSNGWDADVDEYAEVYKSYYILYWALTTTQLEGFFTSRMLYYGHSSNSPVHMIGDSSGCEYYRCKFVNTYSNYPAAKIGGFGTHVTDCIYTGIHNGYSVAAVATFIGIKGGFVSNCQINFGMDASYCYDTIFSNIDIILEQDSTSAQALVYTGNYKCRYENIVIDNSISTTTIKPIMMAGSSSENNYFDVKYRGSYTTLSIYGDYSIYTFTPLLSGDTIDLTGATVSGNYMSVNLENITTNTFSISSKDSIVYIKNLVTLDNNIIKNNMECSAAYSLNHGGVEGYWKGFLYQGTIESTDVYRTGGSPHSLRIERDRVVATITESFPILGKRSRGEVIYLDLVAGTHTVTMYGAHRIFASPLTKTDLYLEVDYLNADGTSASITTRGAGALETDSSTWNGDTDLTIFKMVTTFAIPSNQTVPVRILGSITYEPNTYLYIDPIPVVS